MGNMHKVLFLNDKRIECLVPVSDKIYTNCIKILNLIGNEPEEIIPTDRNSIKFVYSIKKANFVIDIYENSFYLLEIVDNDYSTATFKNIDEVNFEEVLKEYKNFIKSGFFRDLED